VGRCGDVSVIRFPAPFNRWIALTALDQRCHGAWTGRGITIAVGVPTARKERSGGHYQGEHRQDEQRTNQDRNLQCADGISPSSLTMEAMYSDSSKERIQFVRRRVKNL